METQGIIEKELSPVEKQLRDRFVEEFMHDRSPFHAAIRCGFQATFAKQYADQFMNESYVQRKIKELETKVNEDKEDEISEDEKLVLRTLREAMKVGPFASRVAAANKMSAIRGMDAPTKSEQTIHHRGGVMQVPGISNIEDWEKQASESQGKLISDTQN